MNLTEKLRECGVVGAGGAGFPTHVKSATRVEFLIANGAECEPLIHKDAELMKHFPAEILSGMTAMMEATGAAGGKFGIKSKNAESLHALQSQPDARKVEFVMLPLSEDGETVTGLMGIMELWPIGTNRSPA